jgi:hypothetical protein
MTHLGPKSAKRALTRRGKVNVSHFAALSVIKLPIHEDCSAPLVRCILSRMDRSLTTTSTTTVTKTLAYQRNYRHESRVSFSQVFALRSFHGRFLFPFLARHGPAHAAG